jgi:hypothetical protein
MCYQDDMITLLYSRPKLRVYVARLSVKYISVGMKSGEIVLRN